MRSEATKHMDAYELQHLQERIYLVKRVDYLVEKHKEFV